MSPIFRPSSRLYNMSTATKEPLSMSFSILRDINDAPAVAELINKAYLCESFFRKPGCYDRISVQTVESVVRNSDGDFRAYIVGRPTVDVVADDGSTIPANTPICSIFLEWAVTIPEHKIQLTRTSHITDTLATEFASSSTVSMEVVGHFGQVATLPNIQGRGLGRNMVNQAELILQKQGPLIASMFETGVITEIKNIMKLYVLSVRTDVLPWYPKMGYTITKEGALFQDAIVNAEYTDKITIVELEKQL